MVTVGSTKVPRKENPAVNIGLGKRLQARRIQLGLTQAALATAAECSIATLSFLEGGGVIDPHVQLVMRLAVVLDTSLDRLCFGGHSAEDAALYV